MTIAYRNLPVLIGCLLATIAIPTHAGQSTSTGTATLTVLNQCSVTGANVDLGTYTVSQTWQDVGRDLGAIDFQETAGPKTGAINFGGITCDASVPYTLYIDGTSGSGLVGLATGLNKAVFLPHVNSIGGVNKGGSVFGVLATSSSAAGVQATGTGQPQAILGSLPIFYVGVSPNPAGSNVISSFSNQPLAVAGVYTDTLTFTLKF